MKKDNPGKKITIILDNATYHKTASILALQEELDFKFHFLPPYCPHLNLQENVNAYVKRKIRDMFSFYLSEINNFADKCKDLLYDITNKVLSDLSSRPFYNL